MSETPAPANQGIIEKELEELDALTANYWEGQHPGQDSAEASPAVTETSPQTRQHQLQLLLMLWMSLYPTQPCPPQLHQ